eukprot:ctg_1605.g367
MRRCAAAAAHNGTVGVAESGTGVQGDGTRQLCDMTGRTRQYPKRPGEEPEAGELRSTRPSRRRRTAEDGKAWAAADNLTKSASLVEKVVDGGAGIDEACARVSAGPRATRRRVVRRSEAAAVLPTTAADAPAEDAAVSTATPKPDLGRPPLHTPGGGRVAGGRSHHLRPVWPRAGGERGGQRSAVYGGAWRPRERRRPFRAHWLHRPLRHRCADGAGRRVGGAALPVHASRLARDDHRRRPTAHRHPGVAVALAGTLRGCRAAHLCAGRPAQFHPGPPHPDRSRRRALHHLSTGAHVAHADRLLRRAAHQHVRAWPHLPQAVSGAAPVAAGHRPVLLHPPLRCPAATGRAAGGGVADCPAPYRRYETRLAEHRPAAGGREVGTVVRVGDMTIRQRVLEIEGQPQEDGQEGEGAAAAAVLSAQDRALLEAQLEEEEEEEETAPEDASAWWGIPGAAADDGAMIGRTTRRTTVHFVGDSSSSSSSSSASSSASDADRPDRARDTPPQVAATATSSTERLELLSDLDSEEERAFVCSPEETRARERIWMAMNREWLEREAEIARWQVEEPLRYQKLMRKREYMRIVSGRASGNGGGSAANATPAETTLPGTDVGGGETVRSVREAVQHAVSHSKRTSRKINYAALQRFDQRGQEQGSGNAESGPGDDGAEAPASLFDFGDAPPATDAAPPGRGTTTRRKRGRPRRGAATRAR